MTEGLGGIDFNTYELLGIIQYVQLSKIVCIFIKLFYHNYFFNTSLIFCNIPAKYFKNILKALEGVYFTKVC